MIKKRFKKLLKKVIKELEHYDFLESDEIDVKCTVYRQGLPLVERGYTERDMFRPDQEIDSDIVSACPKISPPITKQ